jgi:mannose-6-phosphate isomerase-like protein (cupin superfamily)
MEEIIKPWGKYQVLYEDNLCKIKKITINPNQRISLQSHHSRKETWKILSGYATVWTGNHYNYHLAEILESEWEAGSIIRIDFNQIHRIGNCNMHEPLVFIEIQTGAKFDEDDIVRYEDDYNRIKKEESNGN